VLLPILTIAQLGLFRMASLTDNEERAVRLDAIVPFLSAIMPLKRSGNSVALAPWHWLLRQPGLCYRQIITEWDPLRDRSL
jgi:hypothetical protein